MDSRPPRAVADLLLTAVPDLRDRLLEHRIRRAWPQVVGADAARRAQARSFADGCLTVEADAPARTGATRAPALDQRAMREIDEATKVIPDANVASAARRLLTKAWPGLTVSIVAMALVGCASAMQPTISSDDEIPRRIVAADPRSDAYYSYTVAQMNVQAGRFKDAVPYMKAAIKKDPNSAALWTQLAQLLMRADNVDEAVTAARRAVELAPDQVSTHLTL